MFDGVNLKNCLPSKTKYIGKPIKSNEHNYSIGRPEWQEKWTTTTKTNYTEKELKDNRINLNQPYLFPNHSNFELGYSTNKDVYQSSTKKDYKPIGLSPEQMAKWAEENNSFVRNSKRILESSLLNSNNAKDSISHSALQDPKKQKLKFNYDNITFKYDEYTIDPITLEPKPKDPNALWSYEYYNRDKNKGHPSLIDFNAHPPMTKAENKTKVWDPIANRFFEYKTNIK